MDPNEEKRRQLVERYGQLEQPAFRGDAGE